MSILRFRALRNHCFFWSVILFYDFYVFEASYIFVILPIMLIDIWLTLSLESIFLLPVEREDKELKDGWEWNTLVVDYYPVRYLVKKIDLNKPLAIVIHGWNSTALNMAGRGELYERMGYNVVLFEMRAHGGNKPVEQWALMHICHDLESVIGLFGNKGWLENGFVVHGHSLGGFVAQRVLDSNSKGLNHPLALILESPVTSYVYINNRTCELLRIPKVFHKWLMQRALRYYNRVILDVFSIRSIQTLSIPEWGLPDCPTLLIQAKYDATLGLKHAQLLIDTHSKIESNFQYHILDELKHANERHNSVRDQVLVKWFEDQSLLFN